MLIVVLVLLGLAVPVFILILWAVSRKKEQSKEHTLFFENESFALDFQPQRGKNPSILTISMNTQRKPTLFGGVVSYRERPESSETLKYVAPIVLRTETKHDRLGKYLGINREAQTGDPSFDDAVYIETDAPDSLVRKLLSRDDVRSQVLSWLREGWSNVQFHGPDSFITLRKIGAKQPKDGDPAIEMLFRELAIISNQIPQVVHENKQTKPWGHREWLLLVLAIFGGVGLCSSVVAGIMYPPVYNHPIVACLVVGAIAWLGAVPLAGLVLRGHSNSWRMLLTAMFLLAVGLPGTAVGLGIGSNGWLDRSQPETKRLLVRKTWSTSGKTTSYHVEIDPWNEGEKPISLSISQWTSEKINRRAHPKYVAFTMRQGALGWPWWTDLQAD